MAIGPGIRRVNSTTDIVRVLSRPCVPWLLARTKAGYGLKKVRYAGRQLQTTAHRFVFIEAFGDPGPGIVIDHLCRNRGCSEITHLEAVPQSENLLRAARLCRKGLHEMAIHGMPHGGRRACEPCYRAHRDDTREQIRARQRRNRLITKARAAA